MLHAINPTKTKSWQALRGHYRSMDKIPMKDLFEKDKKRFDKFNLRFEDMLVDYSKNIITSETMKLLVKLSGEVKLGDAIGKMFSGDRINETEGRAVLHVALRNRSGRPVIVDGKDVMGDVKKVLEQVRDFSGRVLSGEWTGYTGKPITDIVNIGIGGSDLGPVMAYEALRHYSQRELDFRFVSNVDSTDLAEAVRDLDPSETLFVISSKTFTTLETMTNAQSARQ